MVMFRWKMVNRVIVGNLLKASVVWVARGGGWMIRGLIPRTG